LCEVIGSPSPLVVILWTALFISAVVVAGATTVQSGAGGVSPERRRTVWFFGVALVVGVVAYAGFLKLLNYFTQPWYYLSLVTFVAVCIDPILWPRQQRFHRPMRAGAAALLLVLTAVLSPRTLSPRHTNLDTVARSLATLAAPGDLILVTRWECGVTMGRY